MRPELDVHHAVAELAERQHGVVARRQLLAAGVSSAAIERRRAARRLVGIHRGVYAVGHRRLTRHGWWLAAVLAGGDRAVLSHRDAAALHGLRGARGGAVDVTSPGPRRPAPGIRFHQTRTLERDEVVTLDGIPVTTPARTLVDLAGVVPRHQLLKALNEAERLGAFDLGALERALAANRTRRGTGHRELTAALATLAAEGAQLTRSDAEDRFRAIVAEHAIEPRPTLNALHEGMEVDAAWAGERVAVEVDGWDAHRTRASFQRDRSKQNELAIAGWTVLRFTHADLVRRPGEVADRIRRAVTRRSG